MCDCITKVDELLKPDNTRLKTNFQLTPSKGLRELPIVATESIQSLRNGRKPLTMSPTFCPFCGVKYEEA